MKHIQPGLLPCVGSPSLVSIKKCAKDMPGKQQAWSGLYGEVLVFSHSPCEFGHNSCSFSYAHIDIRVK